MKSPILAILTLLSIFSIFDCAKKVTDMKAFREQMATIANSPYSRQRIKYIYFELDRNKISNIQYFSSMLEDFLMTINIRGTIYNVEDHLLIAMVNTESEVDTKFLMSHFEGAFKTINIRYPG